MTRRLRIYNFCRDFWNEWNPKHYISNTTTPSDDDMVLSIQASQENTTRNQSFFSTGEFDIDEFLKTSTIMGGFGTPICYFQKDMETTINMKNGTNDNIVIRTDPNDFALTHMWKYHQANVGNVLAFKKKYNTMNSASFIEKFTDVLSARYELKRKDYGTLNIIIEVNECLLFVYLSPDSQIMIFNMLARGDKFEAFKTECLELVSEVLGESPLTMTWYAKEGYGFKARIVPITIPYDITDQAYPYIEGGVDAYLKKFDASPEPVMIMIGDPGTGKTSLIRHYLHKYGRKAAVTFDEEIIGADDFMINFMTNDEVDTLIVEDADLLISSRDKGLNQNMNKFLNMSNGIVAMPKKKIIFSTNLKSDRDIDSALMRPGRCFDTLHFRPLTTEEARIINPNIDGKSTEYTLAEAFRGVVHEKKAKRVGFI